MHALHFNLHQGRGLHLILTSNMNRHVVKRYVVLWALSTLAFKVKRGNSDHLSRYVRCVELACWHCSASCNGGCSLFQRRLHRVPLFFFCLRIGIHAGA